MLFPRALGWRWNPGWHLILSVYQLCLRVSFMMALGGLGQRKERGKKKLFSIQLQETYWKTDSDFHFEHLNKLNNLRQAYFLCVSFKLLPTLLHHHPKCMIEISEMSVLLAPYNPLCLKFIWVFLPRSCFIEIGWSFIKVELKSVNTNSAFDVGPFPS